MKNTILTSLMAIVAWGTAFAQSDNVTLNVKLNPIQTIVINPTQKVVDLEYKTVADYANGVQSEQADHLTVFSTGSYAIQVASESDDISRANGSETISAATLHVMAKLANGNSTPANFNNVSLSTTKTDLISSNIGGSNLKFDITYKGMANDGYINKYFNDENPTIYQTTVTYSIVAK